MAKADSISPSQLGSVAAQVAERQTGLEEFSGTELTETFAIFLLGRDSVERPISLIHDATPMHRWHHQLRKNGIAHRVVRSTNLPGTADPILTEISGGDFLAQAVERAIAFVDGTVAEDAIVRLLSIPAFYIHAFWLMTEGTDQVVVVSMPVAMRKLEYGQVYEYLNFCERLRDQDRVPGDQMRTE